MGTKPVGTNQEHKTEAFVNRKGCGVRERARNECDKRPSSPCKVASCAFLLLTLLGRISNGASMNHLKLCSAFALSLATSLIVADVALAQELSLLEGFGDGFLFHWVFASGRKPNIDGSITYWQEDNAGAVTMRQSPGDPCVFHVNVLNLRPTRGNATLIETIYDLRDITFELVPNHAQAPAGGSFFRMK